MNELRELKRLLKFYDEAKDNEKMTRKEQRELCVTYAENYISKIIDGTVISESIKFDRRNYKIVFDYYGGKENHIEFKFFQNKCSINNNINILTLTIE